MSDDKMIRISYGGGYVEFAPGAVPDEMLHVIVEDLIAHDEASNR